MNLLDKDEILNQCYKALEQSTCDSIINSLFDNWQVWFSGIGATLIGTIFVLMFTNRKVHVTPTINIVNGDKVEDENSKDKKGYEKNIQTIDIAYCEDDQIKELKKYFNANYNPLTSIDDSEKVFFPSSLEHLDSKNVTRSFYVKRFSTYTLPDHGLIKKNSNLFGHVFEINPRFISWSDNGTDILVVTDLGNSRTYNVYEDKLRCDYDGYGNSSPFCYVFRPDWSHWNKISEFNNIACYFLSTGGPSIVRGDWLYLQAGRQKPQPLMLGVRLNVGGMVDISNKPKLPNLWRPGRREIMLMDSEGKSYSQGGARALSSIDIETALSANEIKAGLAKRFEFDDILPPGHHIQTYRWHSAGQFIAVSTAPEYKENIEKQKVWVIHYNTGKVVGYSENAHILVDWVKDSDVLILAHYQDAESNEPSGFIAWNLNDDTKEIIGEENQNTDIRRIIFDYKDKVDSDKSYNANRTLVLHNSTTSFTIRSVDFKFGDPTLEIPFMGKAMWSSSDSRLIAGVGEKDGKYALWLWRVV